MNKTLEKILIGTAIILGAEALIWLAYDTCRASIEIRRESERRGISAEELCKEKGRADVYDLLFLEETAKHLQTPKIELYGGP